MAVCLVVGGGEAAFRSAEAAWIVGKILAALMMSVPVSAAFSALFWACRCVRMAVEDREGRISDAQEQAKRMEALQAETNALLRQILQPRQQRSSQR